MLILAFVLAATQTDTSALGPRLSLQTVVARTLANSPAITSAHGAVRDASAARRVALGAYLPSLSLSSSAGWNDPSSPASLSSTGPTNTYGAGVAASLDLFTGGRRAAQRSVADAETRAADAGWVFERYSTILMAKQGYFAVIRARELVQVAQEFVAAAELGFTYATDRAATGTATRSDVLRARLAVAASRRQWLAAEDTLAMAGAGLGPARARPRRRAARGRCRRASGRGRRARAVFQEPVRPDHLRGSRIQLGERGERVRGYPRGVGVRDHDVIPALQRLRARSVGHACRGGRRRRSCGVGRYQAIHPRGSAAAAGQPARRRAGHRAHARVGAARPRGPARHSDALSRGHCHDSRRARIPDRARAVRARSRERAVHLSNRSGVARGDARAGSVRPRP